MQTPRVSTKRILIVDDFEPERLVLRENLEIQGYTCHAVTNGLEALEHLEATHFDLVITDNKMPIMTGLELLQSLAKNSSDQHPPTILLTGELTPGLSRKAQEAGAQAIFLKPYSKEDLALTITRILA